MFIGNKYNKSEISLSNNNNLVMSNNHYPNLITFDNALQNTQNLNQNLLSNPYSNNLNISQVLNYNAINNNLGNPVNNINPFGNFPDTNNNAYSLNNEINKNNYNTNNNRNLIFNDGLFNPVFQVNLPLGQMPFLANNFNFNSINKEQDTLKIDSLNFNKFNDSIKLINNNINNYTNNSIYNHNNLLSNNLNHGIGNFTFSANPDCNLKNDFLNPIQYQIPIKTRIGNSENHNHHQNYQVNVLACLSNLQRIQSDSQGIYSNNKPTFYKNTSENYGNANNYFHSIYGQVKNQNSDLSSTLNQRIEINKANCFVEGAIEGKDILNSNIQNGTPLKFLELMKQINNNFHNNNNINNNQTEEESCDLNKVLNCYLFLKKNNLINNSNTATSAKDQLNPLEAKESVLNKTQNRSSEENLNKQNDSILSTSKNIKNSNPNKNNNCNNITNNYNYILNNYNVNITPNEGSNILKSITTIVLEKETNKASEDPNAIAKANFELNSNINNNISECEKASQVLNALLLNSKSSSIPNKSEKKSLSENASNDSHLHLDEKGENELSKNANNNNNKDKKVKFTKNPFCLEKIPTNMQIDIIKSISSNSSSSSEGYNCLKTSQSNKKICFKSSKPKEQDKEKEKKIPTRRSNINKKDEELEKEQQHKEFNCYNEFYWDGEPNDSVKKELEEYSQFYEGDLAEILKDEKHFFMNSHFPEMYSKKDNFYFNIKMLNKKRKSQALLNSAYQRTRNYLRRKVNEKLGLSGNGFEAGNNVSFLGKKERIRDVYDIFFNLENNKCDKDKDKTDYISKYQVDKAREIISKKDDREAKGYKRKSSIANANIEIEINLNMNQDSDSNYSPKKDNYKKKDFELNKSSIKEKDNIFANPNYITYTNNSGINLINSVDFIDSECNLKQNEKLSSVQENKLLHEFDKNNINISNAIMNKIWDNKVIENDKGTILIYFDIKINRMQ